MDTSNKETLGTNPFLALFTSNFESRSNDVTLVGQEPTIKQGPISLVGLEDQQHQIAKSDNLSLLSASKSTVDNEDQIINDVLQKVFLITVDNGKN